MFERFSAPARRVLVIAQQEAHGFGHDFIGTEHLLLGVAVQEDQWGALMLARRGLTATRIRSEIERIIGRAQVERSVPGIDAAALATLGIDLDKVRRRVEATFGPGALAPKPACRRGAGQPGALPFTPRAKKTLELSLRECLTQGRGEVMPHDIVLGLLGADGGAAQILAEHGLNPAALRTPGRPPDQLAR